MGLKFKNYRYELIRKKRINQTIMGLKFKKLQILKIDTAEYKSDHYGIEM